MSALMTPRDVSDYTLISTTTLYRLRQTGDGPPYYRIGRGIRYKQAEVDAWLKGSGYLRQMGVPQAPSSSKTPPRDEASLLDAVAEEIRHPGGRTADEIASEIIGLVRHHDLKGVVDGVLDAVGARLFESELMDTDFSRQR